MKQQPSWPAQAQIQQNPKMLLPRTTGRIILKIVIYFIGMVLVEFSLLAMSIKIISSSFIGFFVFFIDMSGLGISGFLFFSKEYYSYCLLRIKYLWLLLGASGIFFVLFLIPFMVTNPNTNIVGDVVALSIMAAYGISLMWIAHLKPSLAQQVNVSVYRILKKLPGKQLVISELLTRLQQQYKCGDSLLKQYIDNLEYIEVVSLLGAADVVCRIKPKPQKPSGTVHPTAHPQKTTSIGHSMKQVREISCNKLMEILAACVEAVREQRSKKMKFISSQNPPVSPMMVQPKNPPAPKQSPSIQPIVVSQQDASMPPLSVQQPNASVTPVLSSPVSSADTQQTAISIFCCYAHEDEQLLEKLKTHLKPQQRQGLIQIWYDRDILAGSAWEQEINEQLDKAQIVLLLVSPDFIASDYCYTKEMLHVLERHKRGQVRAVPIILRPTDWRITPLGQLYALPRDGRPITIWPNRDAAYLDVAMGIRAVVETILKPYQQPRPQIQPTNNAQKGAPEIELIRTRCSQGQIIITTRKIMIELRTFGTVIKSQTLLRTSLTSIDSRLAIPSVFGMGGGTNLTFHGRGRELLHVELIPPQEAQKILTLLS